MNKLLCKFLNKRYKTLIIVCAIAGWICSCEKTGTTNVTETIRKEKVSSKVSYLNIQSFCQDSLGYMWIATLHGLNRYNGYEFLQYFHDTTDPTSLDNNLVFALYLDSSHRLWVGTLTGTNRYDFKSNRFVHYINNLKYNTTVNSFFEDHTGHIWVATHAGPGLVDTLRQKVAFPFRDHCIVQSFWEDDSRRLWMGTNLGLAECKNNSSWEYYPLPGNRQVTSCVYIDPNGIWWLGTNAGLVCFDPVSRTFKSLPTPFLVHSNLSKTKINFIKKISQSKLLIGTETQGLFQYDILSQNIQQNEPWRLNKFNSNELLTCYVDRQKNVWIGTYDKGFSVWNKSLEYFNAEQQLNNMVKDKFITRIVEDRYGNLWIGTRYDGLFHYTSSGKVSVYNAKNSKLFNGNNDPIESLFIDSKNRIWIGLAEELIVGSGSADGHINILAREKIDHVRAMKEDKYENLWIGSWNGLFRIENKKNLFDKIQTLYRSNVPDLCILDSGDLLFSSYGEGIFRLSEGDMIPKKVQISGNASTVAQACVTLFQDSQHRVWMGSYGYGMLCWSKNHYYTFTKKKGLPNDNVLCFQEDRQGNIWISTSNGISNLNMAKTTFTNYSESDGILGNQYHEKGGLKHSDGRIFFTGNHGLTFFNPMVGLPNKSNPVVHLENLNILNHGVQSESDNLVQPMSISYISNITLSHKQSNFYLDYTGFDFIAPDKLTYAYKLDGFDNNWNYVGNFRRATYSNLSAGKYTFFVKAINSDGVESTCPASIQITIKPAPWFSWQAWTLYVLIFISGTFILSRLIFKMKLNRRLLEIEHNEREREHEMSEMKMNFFTNISHELRTPLTLISAPLEQLSVIGDLNETSTRLLNIISRNVQNMLRLINQLLDFRKMENGMMALQVQQEDFIQFIRNILGIFEYPAEKKQIQLIFTPHQSNLSIWFDTDKLEKILHNLLSNALKHTPEKGSINLITQELKGIEVSKKYTGYVGSSDQLYLEIIISDSGHGISEDKLGELFVRYRQISGPSGVKLDYGGSGIGLHYTKRLVETHNGLICARNNFDEGGMSFSFILPIGDVYPENEKKMMQDIVSTENTPSQISGFNVMKAEKPYTILIAEDNVELMDFIRNLLSGQYNLQEALNGDMAWDLVQHELPDLILSDVLMPGISGYQLCAQIKSHPELCHIPVILLTAKSTILDQVEGLEQGADAYICKPFHVDYLLLTIKNLFMARDRLRQYYTTPKTQMRSEIPIPITLSQFDQKMMNKLTTILERELSNSELNVEYIGRDLGFSRTGFYRKIKGLMDMSPIDFLSSYRLRKAAEMLQEGLLSLTEISEKTGFSSYSYFSKSFKKHFGVTPKDYIKNSNQGLNC
jgi:signal transduction histidine kinase/ligand-binding sensor domain-containing protein/DNA-binding response OmpR family regulator